MEKLMENLWACLPSKEDEAKTIIHRIIQHFQSYLTCEERGVALHTLFQEEKGIKSFLNATANGCMKKVPADILCFLTFLLESYPSSLGKYVIIIKDVCLSFMQRENSSADEKDKSLDVLIAVICMGPWTADINTSSIVAQLMIMASHRVTKPTVLRKVYRLMGVLAEYLPHDVHLQYSRLLKALMMDLDFQTTNSNNVQFSIIEGCFDGLSGFLHSFPLDEASAVDGEKCKRIVSYINKILHKQDTHRKTAARAALNLLSRHGKQFQAYLVSEYREWHNVLQEWLSFGKEERIVAKQAILRFYHVMALHIVSQRGTKDMLEFFSQYLKARFERSEDVDIAVKGFCLFAKPLKMYSPEEIPAIFNILAQRSQEECGRSDNHKVADYLDSLSVFSAESGIIHNLQLAILEGLSVRLLCQFAQEEHPSWQQVMIDAVICTLLRLSRCSGPALDMYLNTVVHQGVLRSVSHPIVEDAEILRENAQLKVTTYENYLPFWQNLITFNTSSKGMCDIAVSLSEMKDLSKKLLDKILECVLEIINRLDLSLQENVSSEPIYHCNMEKCMEANNAQDFTVLVNLVNFTTSLLNSLPDQSYLEKWLSPLIRNNIKLSTKHPLVSSFYKFLTCIVLIGKKLDYFEEKLDEMEDVEWRPTVNLLSGFLNDVIIRQTQYRGDLQVSCLRLMLATPSCIAQPLLRICVTPFQSVFRIGCSMLSLAQEGLQTLSCWNRDIPKEKMRILLKAVLPSFDVLLQTRDNIAGEGDDESNLTGMDMVKKVLQDRKKKKLWKHKVNTHIDTELVQLQKEVVLFLSSLDSTSCLSLLDGSEDRVGVTAWQKEKLLMFPLPFPDMKVNVSLDDMLPRLADLALNCSDRQTRGAACELLHAVIMFMLGKEKQLETNQQGRLTALWTHLFPKILSLACDMDLMVNQLFKPLGEQMAHWYSSKTQERSEQTHAFLKALLDGITHQTDAALRDYSASCLHEYALWAQKQGNMVAKVQPVIKFVSSLCLHPCPQKRMGAALAFNSLYSVLREDEKIVDEFWIELLFSLVTSFSMCSITGEDSHTELQVDKSLQHILRVLIECSSKFNLESPRRRIPKEFSGKKLWHVLHWLLKYCTVLNSSCRHSCMKLVDRLAGYVTECRSIKDFILGLVAAEGINSLVEIAESNIGLLTTLPNPVPWDQALSWVYSLLATMESYIWLIEIGVPAELLFTMESSKLMQALMHFLESVIQSPVDQPSLWRPKEMENFSVAKCCTIVRMIDYLTIVLQNGQGAVLEPFWSSNFWEILMYCCLWPSHVGFDSTSRTVEENLPRTVENFLKALINNISNSILEVFKKQLEMHIKSMSPGLIQRFPEAVRTDKILQTDRDLVRGLRVLQTVFQDAQLWSGLIGEASLENVFHSIVEPALNSDQCAPVTLSPLALEHAMSMLKLYFATSSEIRPLILLTLNGSALYRPGLQGDLTHGEHFIACFDKLLVQRLFEQPRMCVEIIEELLSPNLSPRNLTILPCILKSNCRPKSGAWLPLQELIECLLSKWSGFVKWAEGDGNKETWLISLLVLIVQLDINFQFAKHCEHVCSWIIRLLSDTSRSLAMKTDLLHCLPIICSHSTDDDLKSLLRNFREQHFPLDSSEFKAGTEEYSSFVRAFEALLHSLVITGNCTILQTVVRMMTVDRQHACHHRLPYTLKALMNHFSSKPDHQLKSLMAVFSMFDDETVLLDSRIRILNDFLLKLVLYASVSSQKSFAYLVIKKLLSTVKSRVKLDDVARGKQRLMSHIGSWNLLQQIYGIPEKSIFELPGSELVIAAFSNSDVNVVSGKELTAQLTKRAVEAFQCPLNCENAPRDLKEMYRKYLCAVYNMFATLICNLKTMPQDAKFYDKLLFDEDSRKIWRLLVDESKSYLLPYCLTEHLINVEKVTSIRRIISEEKSGNRAAARKTLQLIESQSFAGSLETDISRFDFSHSRVLKTTDNLGASEEKAIIVLESDSLNNHECMATVTGIIRHLVDAGITPAPSVGTNPLMPGWMKSIRSSLSDQTCPPNSHVFLLRVILNCEMHFSPYAEHWIQPVLNCTVKVCLENGISYLLGDIIVCLLAKWSAENPKVIIQRSQANELFHYLIDKCPSTQRAVFKYHLELIKSVLEVWKEYIDPPYHRLQQLLKYSDRKVGINLTAIMLFYNLTPWTVESKNDFLSFLLKNLKDSSKEIFKASSELLGLCLKQLAKEIDGHLVVENFIEELSAFLKSTHLKQRDCDRFLTVLYGVHENYPQIADLFMPTILYYLDQTADDRKALCICLLSKHLESLGENPYQELKGHGLLNMLSDRNSNVQIKAFQVLSFLAQRLPEVDLCEAIHKISSINLLVKGDARHLIYEISLIAFDRFWPKQESGVLSDAEKQIYDESKALLLLGLVDSNAELQKKCFTKWIQEERLPSNAPQRLNTMFSLLYSPLTEEHFLNYSIPLILQGTAVTPDFQSSIFQHGLEECNFEDHNVNPHWRVRNMPMAPMFAQTMASQMDCSDSLNSSFSDSSNQLLATQNSLIFEPTSDFADGNESLKPQSKVNSNMIRSSFLFSQDGSYRSQTSSYSNKINYKQGVGFGAQRLRFVEQSELENVSKDIGSNFRLNRYLGKNTANKVFGMANVRRARMREDMWKDRVRKRESQIQMYRKYRKGDFPDIQIKFADFINPLMELAKRDTIVARKVAVSLFSGVKTMLSFENLPCLDNFQQQTATLLNNVLKTSSNYEPATIGTCLEIAYHCQLKMDSDLISAAATSSDLLALGVLLLESNALECNDEDTWLHLAGLYDGLGEKDVSQAVLLHNIRLGPAAKSALEAHAEEQWLSAKRLYFNALTEKNYDNFYESCFQCMAILSDWGQINKVIRKEVDDNLDKLWEVNWYDQKLLPRLFHSEVLSLIHENNDKCLFMKDMNRWLENDIKGAILKERFSETLSMFCLVKKKFPLSRFFASKTLSKFVNNWSDLNPLFRKRRELTLLSIHNIAEVMGFFDEEREILSADDCDAFLRKLERVLPVAQDSLMQWETRISYRIACMNCMPAEMQSDVKKSSLKMQLSLVEAALQQGNQDFAKKYLSNMSKINFSDPFIETRLFLASCRERHQRALKEQNSVKRLDYFIRIWIQLDEIIAREVLDKCPELSVSAHSAEGDLSFTTRQVLSQEPSSLTVLKTVNLSNYTWLCKKLQSDSSSSSSEFISCLENIGLTSLIHSKNIAMKRHSENPDLGEQSAQAYLQIAQYCRKILESREDDTSHDNTFTRPLVRSTLAAMKLGSNRARQLFPLLLQLPGLSSDLSKDFMEKSATVPKWMFLGWIPQILALLDTPAVDVIGPLLIKIAEKYPNAVSYPYSISRENNVSTTNASKLRVVKKLDSLFGSNTLQMQFVKALSCLTHPSVIVKHHLDKLLTALQSSTVDWSALEKICDAASEAFLSDCCEQNTSQFTGNFFSSIKNIKLHVLFKEFRRAVSRKTKAAASEVLENMRTSYQKILESDAKNIKSYSKLKDFSTWLSKFSSSQMNANIEIPGQYTGDQRPTPHRHVMISRFEENVQVMVSLRKPVKLTIIGSDANSYNFLVKYGEDLRQDERVQQLLCLMNGIFTHNHLCRERHLSIVTYKVVPLSSRVGIIEWVDNTSSLKGLMLSHLSGNEKVRINSIKMEHNKWLTNLVGSNVQKIYGEAHNKLTRNQCVAGFSKLVSMAEPNIARKGLVLWSSSAEAFYWLRHSFLTSYSTLCIAHWLLGVGDRHLDNCLISQTNGRCIGIDFGHVFGSATQFLPVPELVPFRLTPHIVNLAQPHGTTGLIEETMVSALRALQADPEVLLATMQVFIQEPSLDWLMFARKHFEESRDDSSWLPALKIKQAKCKLKGINPVIIASEDLHSKQHRTFLEGYCRTLKGEPSHNIRARLPDENLTPRQQVQCLIDLATDESILAKMYTGWEPWM